MFMGMYQSKLIENNKLIIPIDYYEQFENKECFLFPGPDGNLLIFPCELFDDLFEQIERSIRKLDQYEYDLTRLFLPNFVRLDMDENHCLEIPRSFLNMAEIDSDVVLMGLDSYIEFWSLEKYWEEMLTNKEQTHLFICHSSLDKSFVNKLSRDLQRRGIKVWYSEWELLPGDSLYERIQSGIVTSGFFGIVLSPNSVDSNWCKRELHSALEEEFIRDKVFVVPILYEDCEVPPFLKEKVYVDLREENYEKGIEFLMKRFQSFSTNNLEERFGTLDLTTLP